MFTRPDQRAGRDDLRLSACRLDPEVSVFEGVQSASVASMSAMIF